MLEDVPEDTLQQKYEEKLQQGIQEKLHTLKSALLYDAISFAHDAEKEFQSISQLIRPSQQQAPQVPQLSWVRNNRNFGKQFSTLHTRYFNRTRAPTFPDKNVINVANTKPNDVNFKPKPSHGSAHTQNEGTHNKHHIICHGCNKPGHVQAHCPFKRPPKKPPTATSSLP